MTNIFARHRQTVVRWIIASGIGLATAIAYLRHFVQPQTPRRLDQAILLSYLICLFAALVYLVVFRITWPRLQPFAPRTKIAGGAAALAAGALLVVAIPLNPPASFVAGALSFVADAMSIGALVFVAGVWLATRPARAQATHAQQSAWLWYSAACAIIWMVYLLVFWPGLMSPDSLEQWRQVLQGEINNEHPAFHTLTIWLITRVWFSPAAVALTQIFALALMFGLVIRELERWGLPRWARIAVTALFGASVVNSTMVITLWKDIPYTIATLGLFWVLLSMVRTRGAWLASTRNMAILWLLCVCVSLYRHNGPIVVALLMLSLLWVWRRTYLFRILTVGLAVLIAYFGITGPLYQTIGVTPVTPIVVLQTPLHQTGAILHTYPSLAEDDERLVTSIQPTTSWNENYFCHTAIPMFHNDQFDVQFFNSHSEQFVNLWLRLAAAHPLTVLLNQACVSALVWRITPPADSYFYAFVFPIGTNTLGVASQPKWPWATATLRSLLDRSLQPQYVWWVWRPALYLYLTIFCLSVAAVRLRRRDLLIVGLPTLFNALAMLALIPAPDFRFQYPTYMIGLIAPALLFVSRPCDQAGPCAETVRPLAPRQAQGLDGDKEPR